MAMVCKDPEPSDLRGGVVPFGVWRLALEPGERDMLIVLLQHAGASGRLRVWPSRKRLAGLLNVSERQVSRRLGSLKAKGFVVSVTRRKVRCGWRCEYMLASPGAWKELSERRDTQDVPLGQRDMEKGGGDIKHVSTVETSKMSRRSGHPGCPDEVNREQQENYAPVVALPPGGGVRGAGAEDEILEGAAWDAAMERVWAVLKWRPNKAKPGAGAGAGAEAKDGGQEVRAPEGGPDKCDGSDKSGAKNTAPAPSNTILTMG